MVSHRVILHHSRRALLWGSALFAVLFLVLWVGLQMFILNDLDRYRPDLVAALSRATGTRVEIGQIAPGGIQWLPTVELNRITVFDPAGKPGLILDHVEGSISILGFFQGRIDLGRLLIDHPTLTLHRNAEGQLFLSGIPLPKPDSGPSQFLDWLAHQKEIKVTNATLRWEDDLAGAEPLQLTRGNIRVRNSGIRHRLEVSFLPPEGLARPVTVKADFRGSDLVNFKDWQGQVVAQSDWVNLAALRHWVPQLAPVEQARGRVQFTLSLNQPGQWESGAELDLQDVQARLRKDLEPLRFRQVRGGIAFKSYQGKVEVSTRQLSLNGGSAFRTAVPLDLRLSYGESGGSLEINQLELGQFAALAAALPLSGDLRKRWNAAGFKGKVSHLDAHWQGPQDHPTDFAVHSDFERFEANPTGLLPAVRAFNGHLDATADGGALKGSGADTFLNFPKIFASPIPVHAYKMDVSWAVHADDTQVRINRFEVENADLAGYVSGRLSVRSGAPGDADLSGELQRVTPAAVWRYLPLDVSADARNWLQASLVGGKCQHMTFEVKGNLQQFPFAGDRGGKFLLSAQINDGVLRYDPAWPAITALQAKVLIRGGELQVDATAGQILGSSIKSVQARIPDLTVDNQQLSVSGEVDGSLRDGLAFIAHSPVRESLHHFTDDIQGTGAGHLVLGLDIPLSRPADTKVKGDYQFLDAGIDDGDAGIPPLSHIQGHLLFTESTLSSQGLAGTALGGLAAFQLSTLPSGAIRLQASGTADMGQLGSVYRHPLLADVSGKELWQGEFVFANKRTDIRFDTRVNYLGEPALVHMSMLKDGTLDIAFSGKTSQASLVKRYPSTLLKALDSPLAWNGHLRVKSGHDEVVVNGTATLFQEPAKLVVTGSSRGKTVADVTGKASMASLQRLGYSLLADHAKGTADWRLHIEDSGPRTKAVLTSSLTGVALNFPPPFQKSAAASLPLNLTVVSEGKGLQVNAVVSNWIGFKASYAALPKGKYQAQRGIITFGGEAVAPLSDGFGVNGTFRHADLDQWKALLEGAGDSAHDAPVFGPVTWINAAFQDVHWGGRTWGMHRLTANLEGDHWLAQVRGDQADGEVTWVPEGAGRIRAHFTKLILPPVPDVEPGKDKPSDPDELKRMPSVDLVADRFWARNKSFGRLQLAAVREGMVWRIDHISLASPSATLEGDGRWLALPFPQTQLNLHLKASDLGKFLVDVGYPNMVSRGKGELRGQVNWAGNPDDFKLSKLAGQFAVDLRDGQFSKVEPGGTGRLIGLLSLQTLPRRITLDFHDIFSDGFAFDSLRANISAKQGIFATQDFDMAGPSARVKLAGTINLTEETTSLTARVSPAVGGSVSLATTVLGGPVAGAASFLLQKLLKNPLDKVLTYEYGIEGSWDDPQIKPLGTSAPAAESAR
ncbi:MAG: hypothetical protein KGM83_02960 [Betaproteobacteria bacterium]|nr:hypothetical protein [Betaproteobacteria bacterium]